VVRPGPHNERGMNQLKVHQQESIVSLWKRGWSARRIARELGFGREAVRKYIRLANEATPSPGNVVRTESVSEPNQATPSAGTEPVVESKPATPSAGNTTIVTTIAEAVRANVSLCEVWRSDIQTALDQGLTAKRIHEDLVREHHFAGGYQAVKRYVRRLCAEAPVPFRRMDFAPGEQLQVDFGTGPWLVDETGRKRRCHVFRAVLCCSRAGYSEATSNQKTETFLRCLENAYRHFGGVPATTAPDNLKAAVLHPDWYDPELNPKLASFARHYDTVILPTKPGTPRHKGRVERGIDYVQTALKGRTFASLAAVNGFLADWEKNVADKRIHGTTRQHVGAHFLAVERPALKPLPADLFPSFTEGKRAVHLDGHVEYDKAYYSVPPEYTRREVWVRGESKLVQIYTLQMELIVTHARVAPGQTSTADAHIHPLKRRLADQGTGYLLNRCQALGPSAGAWATAVQQHRPIESIRVMQGLLSLGKKMPPADLDRAASKALQRAGWTLGDLRRALAEPANVVQVDFLQEHPLIRDLAAYRIPFPS
jgi:transposase